MDDWKMFLRFQQALRVAPYLDGRIDPDMFLPWLESTRGGALALSAWYGDGADPALAQRATQIFDQVREVFRNDVAESSLPAADKAVLESVLDAAIVSVAYRGSGSDWSRLQASDHLLDSLQALATMEVREIVAIIGNDRSAAAAPLAHWIALETHVIDRQVRVSPAMLATLASASGQSPEAEWGMLGALLGHELAHLLADEPGLSQQGEALLEQEDAAIQQRIDDLWIGQAHLDAPRVLEEAACDLRGLSAAQRAGEAEAELAGRRFDPPRFFMAAASLHAANPTRAQLERQAGEDPHPPGPFRAELARQLQGFDQAFGCMPRPTAPFGRILPRAPQPASSNPG